jgi:hypothetical protein
MSHVLFLRNSRSIVSSLQGKLLWLSFSILFGLVSMILGGMLAIVPISVVRIYVAYSGIPRWDYPMLWIDFHRLVMVFPFLPTILMILISAGVGLGSAVALMLAIGSRSKYKASTIGSVPLITGFATAGACCCTSCLSTAGIAVIAAVSSVPTWEILMNDWYLGLFQLSIVFLSLLVLERELERNKETCNVTYSKKKMTLSVILKISLLIAGITWSLAMLVEWGEISPLSASLPTWYHWIFEHQLLSSFAILSAFFPSKMYSIIRSRSLGAILLRVGLVLSALTWGFWVPEQLTNIGLGGFLNELFGYINLPLSLGAVPPDSSLGIPLLFHWIFQHELLSIFALSASLIPRKVFAPLLWSSETTQKMEVVAKTKTY